MPTFNVYAPVSGWLRAKEWYCDDQSTHYAARNCAAPSPNRALDIGCPYPYTVIHFWADAPVANLYITYCSACADGVPAPWSRAVKVRMYDSAYKELGTVTYVHVQWPEDCLSFVPGYYSYQPGTGKCLGYTAPDTCSDRTCYDGLHVHMEVGSANGDYHPSVPSSEDCCNLYPATVVGSSPIFVYTYS